MFQHDDYCISQIFLQSSSRRFPSTCIMRHSWCEAFRVSFPKSWISYFLWSQRSQTYCGWVSACSWSDKANSHQWSSDPVYNLVTSCHALLAPNAHPAQVSLSRSSFSGAEWWRLQRFASNNITSGHAERLAYKHLQQVGWRLDNNRIWTCLEFICQS